MKFNATTRLLLAVFICAPVLGGADGGCSGDEVAIGGDPIGAGSGAIGGDVGVAGSATTGGEPSAAGSAGIGDDPGAAGSAGDPAGPSGGNQGRGGGVASNGGTSSATGGSSASACDDEEATLRAFLGDNKACTTDADCQMQQIGCGITEDGCTGTVYVNNETDLDAFNAKRASYYECFAQEPTCAVCERVSLPPDCVSGSCTAGRLEGDICSLLFDAGPCDAAFRVWAFVDGSCQQRSFGGCEGNQNRFNTLEECLATCSPTTGACPPNRVQRSICVECGPAGGCARTIDACALLCGSNDECEESNLMCYDGVCQVAFCI